MTDAIDIVPLLMVAYELGLPSLHSYFLQCLEYLLSNSSVCKVLTIAHFHYDNYKDLDRDLQHDLQHIQDTSLQYIIANFKIIMASQTILDLDKEALKLIVSSKVYSHCVCYYYNINACFPMILIIQINSQIIYL